MSKTTLLAVYLTLAPAAVFAQSGSTPKAATDITDAEIKTVLKNAPPAVDQQLKVVDIGKLNLAVGIIHRGPTAAGAPNVGGISHDEQTETYVIVSGGGTLVTGGDLVNCTRSAPDSEVTKVLNGPSCSGPMTGAVVRRAVSVGDVIIIPAGVPHGWTGITDHVDYLSVRPDPDRILQAGYVNPAIKKQ